MQRSERDISRPTLDSERIFKKNTVPTNQESRNVVSLSITETTPAAILEAPQRASIAELTTTITTVKPSEISESALLKLKRIRRGKAIKLLREQTGINKNDFKKMLNISRDKIDITENYLRDPSLEELNTMIAFFDNDTSEVFSQITDKLMPVIEGKEPAQRIQGKGELLTGLIKVTGSSSRLIAAQLNKTPKTIENITSDKTSVSVQDILRLITYAQDKNHEREEAIAILKSDAREFKREKRKHKNKLLGNAVRVIRRECKTTQNEFNKSLDGEFSNTTISDIEAGERQLKEAEILKIVKVLKSYGADPLSIEMQMLESVLPPETSSTIKNSGRLLGEILAPDQITTQELAENVTESPEYFSKFINGEIPNPNVLLIFKALDYYIDLENPQVKELREILHKQEWLVTLLQPSMTSGNVVKYLRLSTYLSKKSFSQKANISDQALRKSEEGVKSFYVINQAIKASAIGEFHEQDTLAQLSRVKYFQKELMTQAGLTSCDKTTLLKYFSAITGTTFDKMRKLRTTNALIKFLQLSSQDEHDYALIQVIKRKWREVDELDESIYQKAVLGKYLFAEQLEEINPYRLSFEELEIKKELMKVSPGKAMRVLREKKEITLKELGEKTSHSSAALNRIELEQTNYEDYIAAHIMFGLDYDIHHPFTQEILNTHATNKPNAHENSAFEKRIEKLQTIYKADPSLTDDQLAKLTNQDVLSISKDLIFLRRKGLIKSRQDQIKEMKLVDIREQHPDIDLTEIQKLQPEQRLEQLVEIYFPDTKALIEEDMLSALNRKRLVLFLHENDITPTIISRMLGLNRRVIINDINKANKEKSQVKHEDIILLEEVTVFEA